MRIALETPDSVTASAAAARDEIGRAVAAKIRETQSAYELKKVAEDVLPEIEKFLESPAEKRLRRIRVGSIISAIGLGFSIAILLVAILTNDEDLVLFFVPGVVAFFLGLAFVMNGLFLTTPRRSRFDKTSDADSQRSLDGITGRTNELQMPASETYTSVTENTTRHLKDDELINRE